MSRAWQIAGIVAGSLLVVAGVLGALVWRASALADAAEAGAASDATMAQLQEQIAAVQAEADAQIAQAESDAAQAQSQADADIAGSRSATRQTSATEQGQTSRTAWQVIGGVVTTIGGIVAKLFA